MHDAITLGAADAIAEIARTVPPRLAGARVPALVLHGSEDTIAAPAESQALARQAAARTLELAEELQAAALRTAGIHHAPGC